MDHKALLAYHWEADFDRVMREVFACEPDINDQWQNEKWQAFNQLCEGAASFDDTTFQRLIDVAESRF